jgi:hypothetical protein
MPVIATAGMQTVPGTLTAPLKKISGIEGVSQKFTVDPTLPVLGNAYYSPFPSIVIPKFRFVGVRKTASSVTGDPVVTLAHAGTSAFVETIGIAAEDFWRRDGTTRTDDFAPTVWRHAYINYPYVSAVNDANGALLRGDLIAPDQYGRPVKWLEEDKYVEITTSVNNATASPASESVFLTNATISAISPSNIVVLDITDNTEITVLSSAYDTSTSCWRLEVATTATPTDDVLVVFYKYGHSRKDVGGQLIQLEVDFPTSDWFAWVHDNFQGFPVAPFIQPYPLTAQTGQALTANADRTVYSFAAAHVPIAPNADITVYLDGVAETKGNISGLYNGELQGTNYVVDPHTGTITFPLGYVSDGVAVTADYYTLGAYDIGNRVNALGQMGMTDQNTAPSGFGPGYPPAYVAHVDGGSSGIGGLLIEVF